MWNKKPWYQEKARIHGERKTCKWVVMSVEEYDGQIIYSNGSLEFSTRKSYRPCSKFNLPRGAVIESMEMSKEDAMMCAKVLNEVSEDNKQTEQSES